MFGAFTFHDSQVLVHTRGRCSARGSDGRPQHGTRRFPPSSGMKRLSRRPARHGSVSEKPDRDLSMNVNGRLTAPPLAEVELATNSVSGILFQGDVEPGAGGFSLDNMSFGTRPGTRAARTMGHGVGHAHLGEWMHRMQEPVSATQRLFGFEGAAPGR